MKRFGGIFILVLFSSLLLADLSVNVPFDSNIVGPAYADEGNYTFTSEQFYVINNGQTAIFTLDTETENLPAGWSLTWCHELEGVPGCHFGEWEFEFPAGAELGLDAVIQVASAGSFDFSFVFESESLTEPVTIDFSFATADAASNDENPTPTSLSLTNFPNPFNPQTTILLNSGMQTADLTIFNTKGQIVKTFKQLPPGQNSIVWNGTNNSGKSVPSGIYFSKLETENKIITTKMLLLK
ncbi:MAG: hypothetical protein PWQ09_1361 [Candidatus Cloacimonadota bacterium]|jgi:hypothetical protein|nr:hypothetical protein [Candidatus Cloacimonadota bacterium]